jgi:hypothetical protein
MLKFAFDWSSQTERYNKGRSLMAVGLAFSSLALALVLVALMGEVAIDSWLSDSRFEPTPLVFNMVFLVVLALAGVAIAALIRSLIHLQRVISALRVTTKKDQPA